MRYEYKDTGIQSLGEVPSTWKICKIKNYFSVKPSNVNKKTVEGEIEVELCNYVDVYYNDSIDLSLDFMTASAKDGEIKKFQIKKGDVIITKDSEDPMDIAVPALVKETREKLLCGYHLSVLSSKSSQFIGDYLFWVLKDLFIASQLQKEATGITRWAIASRHIKNTIIPFPPLREQKAIADYLDKACTRIDRIIEIKEKQLEKLENYYLSKMKLIFTKGIASTKFKKTDVVWLGDIPTHWKIKKLKRNYKVVLGKMVQPNQKLNTETEEKYFRSANIKWDGIDTNNVKTMWFKGYEKRKFTLKKGDLLVSEGGDVGRSSYLNKDYLNFYFQNAINRIRGKNKNNTKYLFYWMFLLKKIGYIDSSVNKITIAHLTAEKLERVLILDIPVSEQEEIVTRIELLEQKIQQAEKKITKQIKTLKKYRKSLIHECVTGKKQVFFENEKTEKAFAGE